MQREDGTPYVLGTKIFEHPSPDEKLMPMQKGRFKPSGKENEIQQGNQRCRSECHSQACKTPDSHDGRAVNTIGIQEIPLANQISGLQMAASRHMALATTISPQGHSTCISECSTHNAGHTPELGSIPYISGMGVAQSNNPGDYLAPESQPEITAESSSSPLEQPVRNLERQSAHMCAAKRSESRADEGFRPHENGSKWRPCSTKLKGGALRVANKCGDADREQEISPHALYTNKISPDRSDGPNESVLSSFAIKRSMALAKEQNRERDLAKLSAACEDISLKMRQYETDPNRLGKWDIITKQEGSGAAFTEFLLRVTGRLFEHLSDAEHSRELLEEEIKAVKKIAEDSRDDLMSLRAEVAQMKGSMSLEIKQVTQVSENSRTHLQIVDEEQKSLAAQVLSLSRSYEFQCVTNMLSSAFSRNLSSSLCKSQSTNPTSNTSNTSLFDVQSPEAKAQSPSASTSPWTRAPPATSRDFFADLAGDDSLEDIYDEETAEEQDQPRPPPKPQSLPRPLPRRLNGVPLSPVQESPLESTPIREAHEARAGAFRESNALPPQQPFLAWSGGPSVDTNPALGDGGRRRAAVHKESSSPNILNQSRVGRPPSAGRAREPADGEPIPHAASARPRAALGGSAPAAGFAGGGAGARLAPGRFNSEGPGPRDLGRSRVGGDAVR